MEEKGLGTRRVNYKLRDWLFSRQRYWGEPFPVLHGPNGETVTVPVNELPLVPPDLEDFKPTGTPEGPLSKATDWVSVTRERLFLRSRTLRVRSVCEARCRANRTCTAAARTATRYDRTLR